jgi:type II secretory pathway pseudopilin PulG
MELMIALTIIGIIAVVGLKFMGNQTDQARHMQAFDTLKQVQGGIAEYYLKTGNYPELGSWEAMVGSSSPLVTRHMIRVDLPVNDPWGVPYEGKSTKFTFELKCAGRPDKGDDVGPITITQDRVVGAPGTAVTKDASPVDAPPSIDQ